MANIVDAQARARKQWVQKQFTSSGVQLEPAALNRLVQVVEEIERPEEFLHSVLDEIETASDERRVTIALLDHVLDHLEGQASSSGTIQVLDAFQTPLILYDPIRKLFHRSTAPRRFFADAKSKVQLYVDRFLLIQQRMRRNKMFRPPQWAQLGSARTEAAELTELKALLGLVGERRYVVGFLTRQDEGRFAIEDLSARLPLDLSVAETAAGLFTENCIVVAEGELMPGGAFRALALGLPPAEPRAESLAALQGLDYFGGRRLDEREEGQWRAAHADDRAVVLSDVWLDRADVLEKLHTIFAGFSATGAPPSLFVLMGNFQSYDATAAGANFGRLRDHFAALGRLINQYPALLAHSKFLLVPGAGDVAGGGALPRPPLPRSVAGALLEAVPGAELATNPCRVRHGAAELVLFRADTQRRMKALALLPGGDGGEATLFEQLCATVVQESHMCPLPLEYQPIAWEYDHALYLYPMPHALVMADAEGSATHTYDTCACINPGSLASGSFGAWNPVTNEMELCDVGNATGGSDDELEGEEEEEEAMADAGEGVEGVEESVVVEEREAVVEEAEGGGSGEASEEEDDGF